MSPASWVERLERRLDDRWFKYMGARDAYYDGDHNLTFATAQWREAFGSLFALPGDNWMPIVVDSSTDRMKVQGFRFGKQQSADEAAWDIWQANQLDSQANMAHTELVKLGEAYWLVEPPARGSSDPPRITAEHPMQMIVAHAPGDRRRRLAAFKKWIDEDGYAYATLYLPEAVVKYRSQEKPRVGNPIQWIRRPGDPGGRNPLGVVPVVTLPNNPSLLRGGRSDLDVAIPNQDGLNKLLSDMLITSEYMAFPQRVLLGIQVPKDPVTGQPIRAAQLESARSRLWAFEGSADSAKAPQATEFSAADLSNYVKAREHLIHGLTAKTRTPPHYVVGQIVNASGDALKAAETGKVAQVRDKLVDVGEGHEDSMRLAFLAIGDTQKARETSAETIWRDPEARSFGELVDGLVKLAGIGVPQEVLWERAGFSPQEIDRMKTMQVVESLFAPVQPDGASSNGTTPTNAGV